MDRKTIEEKVIELVGVAYRKDISEISADTVLRDLSSRSILLAGLVSLLCEEFNISLSIPEVDVCGNVGAIVNLILEKI